MSSPTPEWVEQKKKDHGKIAKSTLNGDVYIYRRLGRKEHLQIQKDVFPAGVPVDPQMIKPEENAAIEDSIVKSCVLWPESIDVEKLDAGVPANLVPSILYFSGFVTPQEPEEL